MPPAFRLLLQFPPPVGRAVRSAPSAVGGRSCVLPHGRGARVGLQPGGREAGRAYGQGACIQNGQLFWGFGFLSDASE